MIYKDYAERSMTNPQHMGKLQFQFSYSFLITFNYPKIYLNIDDVEILSSKMINYLSDSLIHQTIIQIGINMWHVF